MDDLSNFTSYFPWYMQLIIVMIVLITFYLKSREFEKIFLRREQRFIYNSSIVLLSVYISPSIMFITPSLTKITDFLYKLFINNPGSIFTSELILFTVLLFFQGILKLDNKGFYIKNKKEFFEKIYKISQNNVIRIIHALILIFYTLFTASLYGTAFKYLVIISKGNTVGITLFVLITILYSIFLIPALLFFLYYGKVEIRANIYVNASTNFENVTVSHVTYGNQLVVKKKLTLEAIK